MAPIKRTQESTNSKSKKTKFIPPTREEMQELDNARDLFKSHLFKWQLEELLLNISIEDSRLESLKTLLLSLNETLENIEMSFDGDIRFDFPLISQTENLDFIKPKSIKVIGSFITDTLITTNQLNIDLSVEMPQELFGEKDYVNHKYLVKRSFYLSCLTQVLKSKFTEFQFNFSLLNQDPWKPILLLTTSDSCQIRIIPCTKEFQFHPARLGPSRNSLRPAFLKERNFQLDVSTTIHSNNFEATPYYNNSIMIDSLFHSHLSFLYSTIKSAEEDDETKNSVRDTIKLLKCWLNQRKKSTKLGQGINSFFISMLFCGFIFQYTQILNEKLEVKKKIHPSVKWSSFQLFRVFLEFISQLNENDAIVLCNDEVIKSRIVPVDSRGPDSPDEIVNKWKSDMMDAFDVVVLDNTGCANIASNIRKDTWKWFINECKMSAHLLKNAQTGVNDDEGIFDALFIVKASDEFQRFDHIVRFHIPKDMVKFNSNDSVLFQGSMEIYDNGNSISKIIARRLPRVLEMALGSRVNQITIMLNEISDWNCEDKFVFPTQEIKIGINVNFEQSLVMIEHGPTVEESEQGLLTKWNGHDIPRNVTAATWFRQLWGDKSELRRFKDGMIRESVVWSLPESTKDSHGHIGWQHRAKILPELVKYLIHRHVFGDISPITNIQYSGCFEWASLLETKGPKAPNQSFQPLIVAFNAFSKQLLDLSDLPLSIINVFPCHSAFSYSSVFIPQPHDPAEYLNQSSKSKSCVNPYEEPLDIVLELQSSARWPNELCALQAMKSELLIDLGKRLKESYSDVKCQIVSDSSLDIDEWKQRKDSDAAGYLDVMIANGYTFRCRIRSPVESFLIDKIDPVLKNENPLDEVKVFESYELDESQELWRKYNDDLVTKPIWTQTLQGLVQRYPVLSHTIRIVKRWISSSGLSLHFSDMIIEVLCVKAILDPCLSIIGTNYENAVLLEILNESIKTSNKSNIRQLSIVGSGWSGFVKVLLMLSEFSWKNAPLLLDIVALKGKNVSVVSNSEDKHNESDRKESVSDWSECVLKVFKSWRERDPSSNNGAMFIAVNIPNQIKRLEMLCGAHTASSEKYQGKILPISDLIYNRLSAQTASTLTFNKPSRMIVERLTCLAKSALKIARNPPHDGEARLTLWNRSIFKHNYSISTYDLVIHLNEDQISRKAQNLNRKVGKQNNIDKESFKNIQLSTERIIDFDPVTIYVAELKSFLGHHALIFYDEFGGSSIGISFDPSFYSIPRPFKPTLDFPLTVLSEKKNGKTIHYASANMGSILKSIEDLGYGLVKQILISERIKI